MIYLDVTSSCKSPVNTGVQRAVRGIFRSLRAAGAEVTPVAWDPGLASYCRLSRRELGYLQTPFGGHRRAEAEPGRRANPAGGFSRLARGMRRRGWARIDLAARMRPADALLVPEIFQDNRVGRLPLGPGRAVAVCHDAIALRRPEITPAAHGAGAREYLEALAGFSEVIAVSEETRAELLAVWREAGLAPAPVSVLGWPVKHAGPGRPAGAPPTEPTPDILCVGTFEPRKNHLALLAAADQLWQAGFHFGLTLIGRTTPGHGAAVVEAVARLAAGGRPVRWLRHVDDTTLEAAYARASFTVFPSLAEGFGLPVLESLWHGRPCVCGANGALGEVSQGGGCLAVDQTQPGALAAGMERLLNDHALRHRLAGEARERPFAAWEDYAPALRARLGA